MKIATIMYFAIWQLGSVLSGAQQVEAPTRPLSAATTMTQSPAAATPSDQNNQNNPASGAPEVFIQLEDSPSTAGTNLKDIKNFAETLLQLKLMSSAVVHRGTAPGQACADTPQTSANAGTMPNSTAPLASSTFENGPVFYQISGAIEMAADDRLHIPNLVFDYSVKKCAGSQQYLLVRRQHSIFAADRTLDELNGIANYIAYRIGQEKPRLSVAVGHCTSIGTSNLDPEKLSWLADQIKTRMEGILNESGDFLPSDKAERKLNCTFLVSKARKIIPGVLHLGEDALEVTVRVKTHADSQDYTDQEPVRITLDSLKNEQLAQQFAEDVAKEAIAALRFFLAAERLDLKGNLDKSQAATFLQRGQQQLCVTVSCDANGMDRKGALESLLAAKKLNDKDAEILRYLGQAQIENHLLAEALATLQDARKKLKPAEKRTLLEADIERLLADTQLRLGQSAEAAENYGAALEIYRASGRAENETEVVLKYAQALKLSKQCNKALTVLLEGIHTSDANNLHRPAQSIIREMSARELDAAYLAAHCGNNPPIKDACSSEATDCGAKERIKDECALLGVQRAGQLFDNAGQNNLATVKNLAERALAREPEDPGIRAEALAYKTVAALDSDLPQADVALAEAEKLPKDKLTAEVRDWLARLRCIYWLNMKDYAAAYQTAKNAVLEIGHTSKTILLASEAALDLAVDLQKESATASQAIQKFNEARNWLLPLVNNRYSGADELLAEANHGLNKDDETKDLFSKIIADNPADVSATHTVMWVCEERFFDTDCALNAAKQSAAGFRLRSPEYQLEFVEAAMLKDDNKDAEEWLNIITADHHSLPVNLRIVRDFYAFWLSSNQHNSGAASESFSNWTNGMIELRRSNNTDVGWSFKGAKKLWTNRGGDAAPLFLSMIRALEDSRSELPKLPSNS